MSRTRVDLLAIPPEARHPKMSRLVQGNPNALYFVNPDGSDDWFCGHCGRMLALGMLPHQTENVWLTCPRCSWLNGLDMDLGWARYAIDALMAHNLSLTRLREIALDARDSTISDDEFAVRTADAGPVPGWLRQISVSTLIAILSLVAMICFGVAQLVVAEQSLHAAEHAAQVHEPTASDVKSLTEELHELLQQEARTCWKPPPKSTRGRKHTRKNERR